MYSLTGTSMFCYMDVLYGNLCFLYGVFLHMMNSLMLSSERSLVSRLFVCSVQKFIIRQFIQIQCKLFWFLMVFACCWLLIKIWTSAFMRSIDFFFCAFEVSWQLKQFCIGHLARIENLLLERSLLSLILKTTKFCIHMSLTRTDF